MNKEQHTIEEIIKSIYDFSDVSEKEQDTMITELSTMVSEGAILRGLESANKETQESFNELLEKDPNKDQVHDFLMEHIPNFEELIIEEIKILTEYNKNEKEEENVAK